MQPSAYNPSAASTSRKPLPFSSKNANDVPSPMSCPRPIPSILQPIRRIQLPPTTNKTIAAAESGRNEDSSLRIGVAPSKVEKKRSNAPAPTTLGGLGTCAVHFSKTAGGAGITAGDRHSNGVNVNPNQSHAGKKHAYDGDGGREGEGGHIKKKAKVHHEGSEKENRTPSVAHSVHKKNEHGKKEGQRGKDLGHERSNPGSEREGGDMHGVGLGVKEHAGDDGGRKDEEGDGVLRCCFCGEHESNKVRVRVHESNHGA